jgi:hypothetical protein
MNIESLNNTPAWEWPVGAGTLLRKTILDRQAPPSDRTLAAELAGDLVAMDDPMADLLLSVVQDAGEAEELRARAAISLGPVLEETDTEGFDSPISDPPISRLVFERIRTTLRKIHDDAGAPKLVRRRALEAAVRSPRPWQREAIRAASANPDPEWQLTAVFCMGWMDGFEAQILKLLKSPDPDIHREAVRAAGQQSIDAAWGHVTRLVESPTTERSVLLAAIGAVVGIRPYEAPDILEDLLDSGDQELADAVREAMIVTDFDEDAEIDDAPF